MMALPDSVFGEADAGNTAWILMSASLVLLMTPALAFFYGGLSRGKSVLNMMMMSFGTMGVIGIVYVLGDSRCPSATGSRATRISGVFSNPFGLFGSNQLMETKEVGEATHVVPVGQHSGDRLPSLPLTFAVISVALISGALAERVSFVTWLAFAVVWATLVYFPPPTWFGAAALLSASPDGLAAKIFGLNEAGDGAAVAPIDFAGGTVVPHQRRYGSAGPGSHHRPPPGLRCRPPTARTTSRSSCSVPHSCGSAGSVQRRFGAGRRRQCGQGVVNTTVATAAAMMGWLAVEWIRDRHATSVGAASGVVAGLVAVTLPVAT